MLAWGWRRALIAFVAGALSALALRAVRCSGRCCSSPSRCWSGWSTARPPDASAACRAAAIAGWWFGFGYFLAGLYWVGYAFLVDAKTFGWLLPFAVIGAAGRPGALHRRSGLALARAALDARRRCGSWRSRSRSRVAEWLRGHLFTGFPWNAFGYALTGPLVLAQGAALIGIWGLTFLAVAVFASPPCLPTIAPTRGGPGCRSRSASLLLAALAGYGALRLARTPTQFVDGVRLRIMQPNLQQDEKFNYAAKQQVMSALSRAVGPRHRPAIVRRARRHASDLAGIGVSVLPDARADALAQIADLLPQGTVLITGAVRAPELPPGQTIARAYNSIYVIDHDGSILSVYDKVHLVPFGEYLPFQDFLERLGLMQLTKVPGGFIAGDRRRAMNVPRAPRLLPLICYEIIFPGEAVPRGERPGWLLNLTNDGWFGISTGPYQHFQQARVRAIEEGLPLVRAANTGISAVIDPLGRVIESLPLGTEGVLDCALAAADRRTLYARTGDGVRCACCSAHRAWSSSLRRRVRRD